MHHVEPKNTMIYIFKCISLKENFHITIQILLIFVCKESSEQVSIQIMAQCKTGNKADKSSPELAMIQFNKFISMAQSKKRHNVIGNWSYVSVALTH